MKTKADLKDLLADIDAVLHDNSIEAQQLQAKVLDMLCQPNQFVFNMPRLYDRAVVPEWTEEHLNRQLNEMRREPQAEDAVTVGGPMRRLHWDSIGPYISTTDREDYTEFYPPNPYNLDSEPDKLFIKEMAVDGVLYTDTYKECPFFQLKDLP